MLSNCGAREDSWESLDSKEIKPVNPKGKQPWIFIGRTDAEAEVPIFWPTDVKSWLIGTDPDAGKDWRLEEKETKKDEMVEWHYWFNGHEFGQALGLSDGQGSLACCITWTRRVRHDWATEQQQQIWVSKQLYHFNDIFPIELAAATGALSTAERSYPMSEVRFRSQEDPMPEGRAAKRSYPTSEVRGSGWECPTATAQQQPRGATLCPRSGGWLRGDTQRPRSGATKRGVTPHPSSGAAAGRGGDTPCP